MFQGHKENRQKSRTALPLRTEPNIPANIIRGAWNLLAKQLLAVARLLPRIAVEPSQNRQHLPSFPAQCNFTLVGIRVVRKPGYSLSQIALHVCTQAFPKHPSLRCIFLYSWAPGHGCSAVMRHAAMWDSPSVSIIASCSSFAGLSLAESR